MKSKITSQSVNPLDYSMHFKPAIRQQYHSFLLRMWREDETTPWRIQIENPHTHEIVGFQNMEKFMRFLNEQALSSKGGAG